jgi:hypothetical protein
VELALLTVELELDEMKEVTELEMESLEEEDKELLELMLELEIVTTELELDEVMEAIELEAELLESATELLETTLDEIFDEEAELLSEDSSDEVAID